MDYEAVRQGLEQAIPFNRHVGLDVAEVGDGRGVVRLPDDERLHNHVGSQHAGALFSAGEAASGAAFVGAFAERMGEITPTRPDRRDLLPETRPRADHRHGHAGRGQVRAARPPRLGRQGGVPGRGRDDRRRWPDGRVDDRALARAKERVNATHAGAFGCHRGRPCRAWAVFSPLFELKNRPRDREVGRTRRAPARSRRPPPARRTSGLSAERNPARVWGWAAASRPSRCLRRRPPPAVGSRALDGRRAWHAGQGALLSHGSAAALWAILPSSERAIRCGDGANAALPARHRAPPPSPPHPTRIALW